MFLKNKNLFFCLFFLLLAITSILFYYYVKCDSTKSVITNLGVVYSNVSFKDIISAENGDIYYGGFPSNKLFSFNLYNKQISQVVNLKKYGSIQSLFYIDNKIFIGGYGDGGKLYEYSLDNQIIKDLNLPISSNYINDIVGNKNFIYGVTANGKFFSYDRYKKSFDIYDLPEKNAARLSILDNGIVIGGTTVNATIFSYNPKNNKIEKLYQFDNDTAIAKLIADKNNLIWGSTSPGNKIFNFDYKTKRVSLFENKLLENNYFWDLTLNDDGKIYFSTSPRGLFGYFDTQKNIFDPIFFKSPFPYQPFFLTTYYNFIIAGSFTGNSFIYDTNNNKSEKNIFKIKENGVGQPIVSLFADLENNLVWGGIGLNRNLFNYNIKEDRINKFGNILGIGNIDSITKNENLIYLGLYSGAQLGLYDTKTNKSIILEKIEPKTSRISVLIFDKKESKIFGGTSCDRDWCDNASWFIYSPKNNILKNNVLDGEKTITSLIKANDYLYLGAYPNAELLKINLKTNVIEKKKKFLEHGKTLILGQTIKDFIIIGIDNKLLKVDLNDFKNYKILTESKSGKITSILIYKNDIYFSTKGGELLKYNLKKLSLFSYGYAIGENEQITKIVLIDGFIVGGTGNNGYLFKLKIK